MSLHWDSYFQTSNQFTSDRPNPKSYLSFQIVQVDFVWYSAFDWKQPLCGIILNSHWLWCQPFWWELGAVWEARWCQCVWFRLWCSVAFGSTVVEGDWPAEWNHTTILRWLATYHIYQASLHLYALPAHTHPWSVLSCNALPFVNYWTRPYLLDQPTINLHPTWTMENGRYSSCLCPFGNAVFAF